MSADEPAWRTASRCDSGACVEIGTLGEIVMVRRSPDPDGARLKLSRGEWQEFVCRLKLDGSMASDSYHVREY